MAHLKLPRAEKPLIQPFTPAQIRALLLCCDNSLNGIRNRAIILLLLDTMIRRLELVSIKVTDVDFNHELIKIMGKGRKERYVRIGFTAVRTCTSNDEALEPFGMT